MDQRLKELALKRLGEEPANAQAHELVPRFHLAIEVIDHEAEQNQAQVALDRRADGGPDARSSSSRRRNVSRNAKPTAKKNCGMIVSA